MNNLERQSSEKISKVIRAARKVSGVRQVQLANEVELSQSALSKVESGQLIPSMTLWYAMCEFLNLDAEHAFRTGRIDSCKPLSLSEVYPDSSFHLPTAYRKFAYSKVRAVLPFIVFFERQLGLRAFAEFCASRKIDPDFFVVIDNEISLKFILDMVSALLEKGKLSDKEIPMIVQGIASSAGHGKLAMQYDQVKGTIQILNTALKNAKLYEANFLYTLEEQTERSAVFSVHPQEHLRKIDYAGDKFGDFLCRYKKRYFEKLLSYGKLNGSISISESQCHFRGHDRCIYHLDLRAS